MHARWIMVARYISLLLLCGCSVANDPWQVDNIATGSVNFDSAKLRYKETEPLTLEMTRVGNELSAHLALTHSRFPRGENVRVHFACESREFEDLSPVHEGRMRLRLSGETTEYLIAALKNQETVKITVGDLEQTIVPEQFEASFNRFLGERDLFETLVKGVL